MLGIDIVGIERLRICLDRTPGLTERLFTELELDYCRSKRDDVRHLAGTLAAKEAVIKALALGPLGAWAQRIEITRGRDGGPAASLKGVPGVAVSVSISHDHGVAVAVAQHR